MDVEIYFIVNTVCFEIPDLITWNLIIQLSYRLFFQIFCSEDCCPVFFKTQNVLKTFSSVLPQLHLKSNYYIFRFYLIILRMVVKE